MNGLVSGTGSGSGDPAAALGTQSGCPDFKIEERNLLHDSALEVVVPSKVSFSTSFRYAAPVEGPGEGPEEGFRSSCA